MAIQVSRFEGKEKRLSLGVYPDVGLKDARDKHAEARKLLAAGVDPSANKKAAKAAQGERAANSFEIVAREWFDKHAPNWKENHSSKIIRRLEVDIFPWLGARPVGEITAPDLLASIRRIESRGALETAHRALANCGQVFRYAIATGRAQRDTAADLRGSLPPVKEKHHASITDPKAIGELLRDIEGYQGAFVTKYALRLAPLVFLRPGELRKAEWAEIDLDKAEWRIPAARMKMNAVHIVPLAPIKKVNGYTLAFFLVSSRVFVGVHGDNHGKMRTSIFAVQSRMRGDEPVAPAPMRGRGLK